MAGPRHVLVVEDEPQVAAMLNDVLTTWGYAVEVARTGPDAFRAVLRYTPDVVLLNLVLPGIPGELILESLHAADSRLPIIVMTGKREPDLERRVRARGAYDFIAKPFDIERLRLVVQAALTFRN
jgi:two-component system phosphate regulon response regulator PhoB